MVFGRRKAEECWRSKRVLLKKFYLEINYEFEESVLRNGSWTSVGRCIPRLGRDTSLSKSCFLLNAKGTGKRKREERNSVSEVSCSLETVSLSCKPENAYRAVILPFLLLPNREEGNPTEIQNRGKKGLKKKHPQKKKKKHKKTKPPQIPNRSKKKPLQTKLQENTHQKNKHNSTHNQNKTTQKLKKKQPKQEKPPAVNFPTYPLYIRRIFWLWSF